MQSARTTPATGPTGINLIPWLAALIVLCVLAVLWKVADGRKGAAILADNPAATDPAVMRRAKADLVEAEKDRAAFIARSNADKNRAEDARAIDALNRMRAEYADALQLADVSPRIALPARIERLQQLRRDVAGLLVPGCAGAAKESLLASMDLQIDGFLAFLANAGVGKITAMEKFDQAKPLMEASAAASSSCRVAGQAAVHQ